MFYKVFFSEALTLYFLTFVKGKVWDYAINFTFTQNGLRLVQADMTIDSSVPRSFLFKSLLF